MQVVSCEKEPITWEPVQLQTYTRHHNKYDRMLSVSNTRVIISQRERKLTGFYRLERAGNLPIFKLCPVQSGTVEIKTNKGGGQYLYSTAFCSLLRSVYKITDDVKTAHIDYRIDSDHSIIIGEKLAAQICKENAS